MSSQPQPLKSADLDDLRQQQLDATLSTDGRGAVPHIAGNTADGRAVGYQVPAHEAHRLHVRLVTSTANAETRQFETTERDFQASAPEFERMEKNDSFRQYDAVKILHDPRPKPRQQADLTGDVATGSPAEPPKFIDSLNAAQMRYRELTGMDAPTDKTFGWFIDRIAELEAEKNAEKTTPNADRKPLRNKADYQARYRELSGEDAPPSSTVDELKEAIDTLEKAQG